MGAAGSRPCPVGQTRKWALKIFHGKSAPITLAGLLKIAVERKLKKSLNDSRIRWSELVSH